MLGEGFARLWWREVERALPTGDHRRGTRPMSNVDLARVQFASTSIYHFLFVPVTIGLAFLVAVLQTRWHRSGDPEHRRLIRFFGTLLLINVAIGVVTGLVQEFEFGMNWSAYSRYVGEVFGAPLAMEGLAAFFFESTFLGLWVFGWGRLPKRVHLACIWLVAVGTIVGRRSSWRPTPGCSTPSATPSTRRPTSPSSPTSRAVLHQPGVPVGLQSPRAPGVPLVTGSTDHRPRLGVAAAAPNAPRALEEDRRPRPAVVLVPAIATRTLLHRQRAGRPGGHLPAE